MDAGTAVIRVGIGHMDATCYNAIRNPLVDPAESLVLFSDKGGVSAYGLFPKGAKVPAPPHSEILAVYVDAQTPELCSAQMAVVRSLDGGARVITLLVRNQAGQR